MNNKEKIKKIIENGEKLLDNRNGKSNPEFSAWNSSLIRFMERVFGEEATDTKRFKTRSYYPSVLALGADNSETIYHRYKKDLETTISELKVLLDEIDELEIEKNITDNSTNKYTSNVPNITLNVDNSNYNSNTNIFNISLESIITGISNDKDIIEEEKEEIIESINEIVSIQNSKLPKKDKWKKTKMLLTFLMDKGVDFVIAYLPQIINLIKNIGGL